jgi:ABC-type transporter Mla subunit MlaD
MKKIFLIFITASFIYGQEIEDPWQSIKNAVNMGLESLEVTDENIQNLEIQINNLTAENEEQENLLRQSQALLSSLKESLKETQENLNKASDDILAINDTNQQIISLSESILKDNERYLRQIKISPYITFGSIGLSLAGGGLMTYGVIRENNTALITGASITGGIILIYSLGHYLLQWF